MSKQIIITQDNYGIKINNRFIKADKTPIDITGCTCNVDMVAPDNTKTNQAVEIILPSEGLVRITLDATDTAQEGLYKLYFNLLDASSMITAKNMITYYIVAKTGGV